MKTNPIINYLNNLASLGFSGEQKNYYVQRAKDARPVECVRMVDVFTPAQMLFLQKYYKPQVKQCYKNAADLVMLMSQLGFMFREPAKYVEGISGNIVPIDHAFVKVGSRYIDPTYEMVLKKDVRKETYVSLIELDPVTMGQYLVDSGYYGNLYQHKYILDHYPESAAKLQALKGHGK